MNFNWLIPSLLISYLGNDRVPKSLSTTLERQSSDNSSPSPTNTTTTTTTPFIFSPPISHPHDLDYLSPLFSTFFLLPPLLNTSSSLIISPLATKLSLLTLITLGDDGQQAELLRQLEVPPLPPLANSSTELLHQGANLRHYLTTTTTRTNSGKLHNYFFAIDSLLFVDRQLFYYDYDHQLADRLESSGLLSLGFYPLKVAASSSFSAEEVGSSTAFESWRQFEAFKRTHLPRHFHPFSKQLKLPEENTLTTLTSFSQQWPLPFNRLAASKYSIPFYHHHPSGQQFSRPPFLTRVLHNSRYLHHQHRFGASFVEVPFEEDSSTANSQKPSSFSLIIALPDQNSSLTTLIQGLSQYRALPREVLPYLQPTPVNLTLPAFQLTSSNLDLMDSLLSTSLSLSSSSQSKENHLNLNRLFPSISTRLSSVTQLCSLSLTSTGVYSSFSEDDPLHLPPDGQHDVQPVYVRAEVSVLVNRPFLFLITETITSTGNGRNMLEVLYAGAVLNP